MHGPSFAEYAGIQLKAREHKPRRKGLCMVTDTGYSLPFVAGVLEQFGHLIDIVRLTELHLTAPLTVIRDKVRRYREAGVKVQPGGIVVELARQQKNEVAVLNKLHEIGFDSIEVSGSATSPGERDAERDFVASVQEAGFTMFGVVGPPFDYGLDADATIARLRALLDGGADKVYWQGLGRILGEDATDILARVPEATAQVKAVVDAIGSDRLIFEVSGRVPRVQRQAQQSWLVRNFGPDVNVGNLQLEEVQFLEHIRLGTGPVSGCSGD